MPLRADLLVPPPNPLPELRGLPLHVLGARGRGMRPVTLAAMCAGADVDGCDRRPAIENDLLERTGIRVFDGQDAAHAEGKHLVVTTMARPDSAEVEVARSAGRLHHRAELLLAVMRGRPSVAVTGTHGKGTVAALAGVALDGMGADPLLVLGVNVRRLGGSFRSGAGPAVVEADDADGTIARVVADVSVVTNSWFDHPIFGRTRIEVIEDVARHVAAVPPGGRVIVGRGRNLGSVARAARAPVWRLGRDLEVETCEVNDSGRVVRLHGPDGETVRAQVRVHGGEIADNVALAYGALRALGVDPEAAAAGLGCLDRLVRRLEPVGEAHGVRVFDDIGKHPEAVAATLAAARELRPRRLHVVYEPHLHHDVLRWSRRWARVLGTADSVVLLPVNLRSVLPVERTAPVDWARRAGLDADLAADREQAAEMVARRCRCGDAVVVLGFLDDLGSVSRAIVAGLRGQATPDMTNPEIRACRSDLGARPPVARSGPRAP